MSTFNEWWQKEEDLMRKQGADDEVVMHVMRNIAELAWNAAQPQWQPIETAPESGPFLVYGGLLGGDLFDDVENLEVVKVSGRYADSINFKKSDAVFEVADADYYGVWVVNPTHWMPLPAAPQEDE